ncbi:hypothetical protein BVY03_01110 [bacterium K02(2017)]|nr:hypothetical protein BVY03_01110 [bacterium K02(2017)]
MQLVILAAGQGIRLGAEAQSRPKSLVPIYNDTTYLSLQINQFKKFNFSKIIIVGGYGYEDLKQFLATQTKFKSQLIYNKDYKKGNLYTVLTAKELITEDFYLFNADHFYSENNYQKIFNSKKQNINICCDTDRILTDDDMKVVYNNANHTVSMSKTLNDYNYGYVGVSYIPTSCLNTYWKACDLTAQKLGEKANVEAVINELSLSQNQIDLVDISGSWWTEIDTPDDLVKAKKIILKNSDLSFDQAS